MCSIIAILDIVTRGYGLFQVPSLAREGIHGYRYPRVA
jgi:hypothetical protein